MKLKYRSIYMMVLPITQRQVRISKSDFFWIVNSNTKSDYKCLTRIDDSDATQWTTYIVEAN